MLLWKQLNVDCTWASSILSRSLALSSERYSPVILINFQDKSLILLRDEHLQQWNFSLINEILMKSLEAWWKFRVIDWLLIVTHMNSSIIMFIISLNMAYKFCYLRHEREINQAPSLSHITTTRCYYHPYLVVKISHISLSGISETLSMKWSVLKMLHFHHTKVNQIQYAKAEQKLWRRHTWS